MRQCTIHKTKKKEPLSRLKLLLHKFFHLIVNLNKINT